MTLFSIIKLIITKMIFSVKEHFNFFFLFTNVETTLQEDVENAGSQIPNDLLDTRPSRKKVSRLLSQSPVERQTRKKILNIQTETAPHNESKSIFSRTPSGSPVKHVSRKNASELSSSTPIEEQVRKKVSRALSESPIKRPSKFSRTFCRSTTTELSNITSKSPEVTTKSPQLRRSGLRVSRSPSQSPIVRRNEITVSKSGNTSPELRYSSLNDNKNPVKSPILRTRKDTSSVAKDAIIDNCQKQINSFGNKSIQYTLEETLRATKTYLLEKEEAENMNPEVDEEKTPKASGNGFTKITKTLTPSSARQKTILYDDKVNAVEEIRNQITKKSEEKYIPEKLSNSFSSLTAIGDKDENEFEVSRISKKKKKLKKDEKLEEVVDESAGNVRITRTKSKAIKEMLQENNIEIKQQQVSYF